MVPGRMVGPPWLREWKLSSALSVGGVDASPSPAAAALTLGVEMLT